jgi:hypothetical protein
MKLRFKAVPRELPRVIPSLLLSAVLVALSISAEALEANELRSTISDQQALAVTIYNGDLALVKDVRKIKLQTGLNHLALRDVSALMRPETALLHSLSHPDALSTLEQNFDFDLLTPEKLLEKYVGKTVSLVKTNPSNGAEVIEQATVLSANHGVVLKIGQRIETGLPQGLARITYDQVPENLRDRPTLVTTIQNKATSNKEGAEQTLELSYLTAGLAWKADYVAELNAKEDRIDLSGWVTLTNTSGTAYRNAKLQLVAGDVHRVEPQQANPKMVQMDMMRVERAAAPMTEESLLEYHLYSLDRLTSIAENQTKQVALLSASSIPAKKSLILTGGDYYYAASYGDLGQKLKVSTFMEFDNKEASKLGMPLPKGVMRVYKKDSAGNAQFVGEDAIDHTPKNEAVKLKLGEAFDVTADKKQTEFKKISERTFESGYSFVIKNAKSEPVTVTVQEPIPGDWKVITESQASQKVSANMLVWHVQVPANSSQTLKYRVRVKH